MNILRGGIKRGGVAQWVLSLLVLAFAVRALVPPGYMPEFSQGVFKVVICTASGSKILHDSEHDNPQAPSHHGQPCAFAGLAVFDVPQFEVVAFRPVVANDAGLIAPLAVSLPPARAGPPLGSRGPPSIS